MKKNQCVPRQSCVVVHPICLPLRGSVMSKLNDCTLSVGTILKLTIYYTVSPQGKAEKMDCQTTGSWPTLLASFPFVH